MHPQCTTQLACKGLIWLQCPPVAKVTGSSMQWLSGWALTRQVFMRMRKSTTSSSCLPLIQKLISWHTAKGKGTAPAAHMQAGMHDTNAGTHTHAHTCTRTHMHAHTHAHTCTHTHVLMHTGAHSLAEQLHMKQTQLLVGL